jgi:hypothetical protein
MRGRMGGMNADQRKGLLADLARVDQQISEYKALAASQQNESTRQRVAQALADAKVIRKTIEQKLRAE